MWNWIEIGDISNRYNTCYIREVPLSLILIILFLSKPEKNYIYNFKKPICVLQIHQILWTLSTKDFPTVVLNCCQQLRDWGRERERERDLLLTYWHKAILIIFLQRSANLPVPAWVQPPPGLVYTNYF